MGKPEPRRVSCRRWRTPRVSTAACPPLPTPGSRLARRPGGTNRAYHGEMESFEQDPARSYGAPGSGNALVHGENLDAMRRLARAGLAGRFRCIYFDPPFNSGRRFAEYDDALEPAAWRAMMLERLVAARDLLADSGAIFVE